MQSNPVCPLYVQLKLLSFIEWKCKNKSWSLNISLLWKSCREAPACGTYKASSWQGIVSMLWSVSHISTACTPLLVFPVLFANLFRHIISCKVKRDVFSWGCFFASHPPRLSHCSENSLPAWFFCVLRSTWGFWCFHDNPQIDAVSLIHGSPDTNSL